MAKTARRKSVPKGKGVRSKAGKTKAKTKARRKAKPARKAVAKRSPRRASRPKAQTGIIATVTGALHSATESIKETALLRNKLERPGESETG